MITTLKRRLVTATLLALLGLAIVGQTLPHTPWFDNVAYACSGTGDSTC